MNNYMKSEWFRLKKKKLNFVITSILAMLVIALAGILEYFAKTEPDFPYGNALFYYSNVFSMSNFIILIVCFLAVYLLGKDRLIIPVSISLGIERKTIFFNKFIISFIHFLIVIFILGVVTYFSGELILTNKTEAITNDFIISLANLLPILISAFVFCYVTTFILENEIVACIIVFVFYRGLALIMFGATSLIDGLESVENYIPATALNEILQDFMNGTVQFNAIGWVVNIVFAIFLLFIGLKVVEKKDFA